MSVTKSIEIAGVDLVALDMLARTMVRCFPSGLVIGLIGTLGAGKTTLVQSLARSSRIDASDVTSPTFTLLQSHRGDITIHHCDAYRLADEDEFLELGIDELMADKQAWTIVEWADRVRSAMPPETVWLEIRLDGGSQERSLVFTTENRDVFSAFDQLSDALNQQA